MPRTGWCTRRLRKGSHRGELRVAGSNLMMAWREAARASYALRRNSPTPRHRLVGKRTIELLECRLMTGVNPGFIPSWSRWRPRMIGLARHRPAGARGRTSCRSGVIRAMGGGHYVGASRSRCRSSRAQAGARPPHAGVRRIAPTYDGRGDARRAHYRRIEVERRRCGAGSLRKRPAGGFVPGSPAQRAASRPDRGRWLAEIVRAPRT